MGLPIRRPKPKEKQIVLAFPDELDDWVRQQSVIARAEPAPPRPTSQLVTDSRRLSLCREPLKMANRAGLERMHLLLAQMVRNAQLVRARTEDLVRNAQQLQRNGDTTSTAVPLSRRVGSIP